MYLAKFSSMQHPPTCLISAGPKRKFHDKLYHSGFHNLYKRSCSYCSQLKNKRTAGGVLLCRIVKIKKREIRWPGIEPGSSPICQDWTPVECRLLGRVMFCP